MWEWLMILRWLYQKVTKQSSLLSKNQHKVKKMKFQTKGNYHDRESKAFYVWSKYPDILRGKILDVGADKCYLKKHLDKNVSYVGIGLGDAIDINVDLEQKRIPFEGNSFDVVLCCDVLEHIENIHVVFDELCRVSKEYVIISLPNCHSAFLSYLKYGDYPEHQHLKFYGLPLEKPEDRHKWFFSTEEAERFIRYRAKKNNMEIDQMDVEGSRAPKVGVIEKLTFKFLLRKYFYLLPQSSNRNLYTGTLWAVLKREMF